MKTKKIADLFLCVKYKQNRNKLFFSKYLSKQNWTILQKICSSWNQSRKLNPNPAKKRKKPFDFKQNQNTYQHTIFFKYPILSGHRWSWLSTDDFSSLSLNCHDILGKMGAFLLRSAQFWIQSSHPTRQVAASGKWTQSTLLFNP